MKLSNQVISRKVSPLEVFIMAQYQNSVVSEQFALKLVKSNQTAFWLEDYSPLRIGVQTLARGQIWPIVSLYFAHKDNTESLLEARWHSTSYAQIRTKIPESFWSTQDNIWKKWLFIWFIVVAFILNCFISQWKKGYRKNCEIVFCIWQHEVIYWTVLSFACSISSLNQNVFVSMWKKRFTVLFRGSFFSCLFFYKYQCWPKFSILTHCMFDPCPRECKFEKSEP